MRHLTKFLLLVAMTVIPAGGMPPAAYGLDDAIIAVVNDEVITFKDLQDYVRQTYVSLVAQGIEGQQLEEMMDELKTKGIEKLIEDKLILSRANEIGVDVRDKLVDERVAEIKAKYSSEQVFEDALVKNGASMTDLRNRILEQLKIKFVIDHEVRSGVFVNPQEVTEFYEANKNDFQKARRVNLESIYIGFIGDPAMARQRAQEALRRIKEGKDFPEVARQYSDAPSLGTVEEGQLVPQIEEVVFKLSADQVSGPVETQEGIYIFKLKGETPAQVAELKEVKDRIYDFLFRKKFAQHFEQWLAKLKAKAYVEIKQ